MRLRLAGAAILVLGTIAANTGAAEARDGCGPWGHRGYYGYCRPNVVYRPIVVRPIVYGPRWHRWGGYRHPWGWHGGYRHAGRHHRW
ncbi:GCG_CRPN prefix-to-repeats domain-containing protein [Methylobacterium goesingense]|uniref:GCG_CRPN prefix-to-repeats domain-containing protein n=1 Tax=Methylobacterium TaxID=407 RepID=UPI0009EAE0E7|nr:MULTISPECIES: hypothetical protein [Methylobacterium]MCI9882685.1 hypothetical protein [Methylobacterium goesingense]